MRYEEFCETRKQANAEEKRNAMRNFLCNECGLNIDAITEEAAAIADMDMGACFREFMDNRKCEWSKVETQVNTVLDRGLVVAIEVASPELRDFIEDIRTRITDIIHEGAAVETLDDFKQLTNNCIAFYMYSAGRANKMLAV